MSSASYTLKKKRELALVKLFQKQQIVDCFKPIKFELIFKGALNQSGLNDSIEWFYQKGLEKKKEKNRFYDLNLNLKCKT